MLLSFVFLLYHFPFFVCPLASICFISPCLRVREQMRKNKKNWWKSASYLCCSYKTHTHTTAQVSGNIRFSSGFFVGLGSRALLNGWSSKKGWRHRHTATHTLIQHKHPNGQLPLLMMGAGSGWWCCNKPMTRRRTITRSLKMIPDCCCWMITHDDSVALSLSLLLLLNTCWSFQMVRVDAWRMVCTPQW